MKIHPFCMTCGRDADLLLLMLRSYYNLKPAAWHGEPLLTCEDADFNHVFDVASNGLGRDAGVTIRLGGFNGGCGWDAAMRKLQCLRDFTKFNISDQETKETYLLLVDSDVVFCSQKWVPVDCTAGVWGLPHSEAVPGSSPIGGLKHLSGGMWLCRLDVLKMMADLDASAWDRFRSWMIGANLTENEDVVLSLMAQYICRNKLGAVMGRWTGREFFSGDPHCLADGSWEGLGAVHLNTEQKTYMGQPIEGKWEIPGVLKKLDVKPWSNMLP